MYLKSLVTSIKVGLFGIGLPNASSPYILSAITFNNIVFSIKWASFWGGLPYEWDQKNLKIIVTKNSYKRWICLLVIYSVQIVFSGFRVITKMDVLTIFDKAFAFNMGLMIILILVLAANVGNKINEFSYFVNSSLGYLRTIKERSANQLGQKWNNGCEELMIMQRIALIMTPFLITLHYLQKPYKPVYITSIIPRENIFYPLIYILVALVQLMLEIAGCGAIMAYSFVTMGIVFTHVSLMNEIRPGKPIYRTKPKFRKPDELRVFMRSVQLIGIALNISYRDILMFIQTIILYATTICVFALIRFWDKLGLNIIGMLVTNSISMIGIWSTTLTMASLTFTKTEASLNSWRNFNWSPIDKKLMKKFRKSIRPIQLEFSGFYYVRPKKILTFWNTLVWLVVRALVAVDDSCHHECH